MIEIQKVYFKKHGRYGQLPRPEDQKEELCSPILNIRVDVYEGPKGFGYIIVEFKDKQTIFTDYGPENRSRVINE